MPIATPTFTGVWVCKAKQTANIEESNLKYNKKTKTYLVRTLVKEQITHTYEKRSDSDNLDVNADKLAIEDLNIPAAGKPWEKKLQSLSVTYNPSTGVASCVKVITEEDEVWTRKSDIPVSISKVRIV